MEFGFRHVKLGGVADPPLRVPNDPLCLCVCVCLFTCPSLPWLETSVFPNRFNLPWSMPSCSSPTSQSEYQHNEDSEFFRGSRYLIMNDVGPKNHDRYGLKALVPQQQGTWTLWV